MDSEFDIAIIGMACRFPGAASLEEFWRNLAGGVESIARLSDAELLAAGISPEVLARSDYVKASPVLTDPAQFDAGFFGYAPAEAALLDPQQRILLELAHSALEDAGCNPRAFPGPIGVFVGSAMNTYFMDRRLSGRFAEDYIPTLIAHDKDFLATRISYKLGLRGPSLSVQTACSTSLVATHLARQSLLGEECDVALAGAVSVRVPHRAGYFYDGSGVVSADGHVRAFDAAASGTVFGSGAGVVVLKRLADAQAQGDRIYAVIKGSAINNDGSIKGGYTAPSVDGQAAAVVEALANAGLSAGDISYLEAHGSGTPVGDRIEMLALTQAFRQFTERTAFCAIGSVKTNVGHLDAAAGMAGLIKTALSLHRRILPPSLNFTRPNEEIDFPRTPFFVNVEARPWDAPNGLRRAGVMATGMGGTNAHVVLEEAPAPAETAPASPPGPQVWLLSAKSAGALEAAASNLSSFLANATPPPDAADIAFTLQRGREAFAYRRFVLCSNPAEGAAALGSAAKAETGEVGADGAPPVLFLLPGIGDHHVDMGRGLYQREKVFREEFDRCAEILRPLIGRDIREVLYPPNRQPKPPARPGLDLKRMLGGPANASVDPATEELNQTRWSQPALFAVEYALARQWMAWGVKPARLVGHSLGEYTAACLAGVFSLPDTLRLIAARARLVSELPPGEMLAVMLAEKDLVPLLGPGLSIALINGPQLCVVAGAAGAAENLKAQLKARQIIFRPVRNGHAFHSRMMDPIVERFAAEVAAVPRHPPQIPFVSNVTGDWISAAQATDPRYWAEHARSTVRFADALERVWTIPAAALLEIGPGRTLGVLALQHPRRPASAPPLIVSSLGHDYESLPDAEVMRRAAGRLWLRGVELRWNEIAPDSGRRKVPLPTYPFQPERHWLELPEAFAGTDGPAAPVHARSDSAADWTYVPAWERAPLERGGGSPAAAAAPVWAILAKPGRLASEFERCVRESGAEPLVMWPADAAEWRRLRGRLREKPGGAWKLLYVDGAFDHLLQGVQILAEDGLSNRVRLGIVGRGLHEVVGGERLDPAAAQLTGIALVAPKEHRQIETFLVDLPLDDLRGDGDHRWARWLRQEFEGGAESAVVAYRDKFRWRRVIRKYSLAPVGRGEGLRQQGVYLIVGGTGGLGWEVAKHLARVCQARLILTRKSAVADSGPWRAEIEALGGKAEVFSCDITDRPGMKRLIDNAAAAHGRIDGAIHCAGILQDGVMALKTPGAVAAVLKPKTEGAPLLHELLRPHHPDFLVLFSSLAAVAPFHGQSDYCSANAFLDTFAAQASATAPFPTLSIDWPIWREAGIFTRMATPAGLQSRHDEILEGAIATDAGLEILGRALCSGLTQLIVTPLPWEVMLRRAAAPVDEEPAPAAETTDLAPEGETGTDSFLADVEKSLTAIWCKVFGLPSIGRDDNFLDLGGHSLLAAQIVAQIRATYRISYTLRSFFETPTIAEAAVAIQDAVLADIESLGAEAK